MPSLDTKDGLKFIDIGANLLDSMYEGRYHGNDYPAHENDLDAVLQRAWDAGVSKIIITAGNLSESKAALQLAMRDERLFSTVGVHPTRCGEFASHPDGPQAYMQSLLHVLEQGVKANKVVAVGECGLDYDRLNFCDAATQKTWFEAQFALVRASRLPMFLHLRGSNGTYSSSSGDTGSGNDTQTTACRDFLEILNRHLGEFPAGVVHSFDGTAAEATEILSITSLDIGINGCSLKTEENLGVVATIPPTRLHLETDAPWCDIRASHAGFKYIKTKFAAKDKKKHDVGLLVKGRNEPCSVRQVLEIVAAVQVVGNSDSNTTDDGNENKNLKALADQVYKNSQRVFFSPSSSEMDKEATMSDT